MKKLYFICAILLSGFIFSQEITKGADTITEQIAEFPDGGVTKFRQLIADNFREKKVQGQGKNFVTSHS